TVDVNQRDLVHKVFARYPEEFTVFRELLQNADSAGAENFAIVFQSPQGCASNESKLDLNSAKVFKWLVKNDGAPFQESDWKRLTKTVEDNPDQRNIDAVGIGFFSVFNVTDNPIVKSNGAWYPCIITEIRHAFLYAKREHIDGDRDNWTVIEMELKQESVIPRIFELTRFLATSITFLARIRRVTISLDDIELSCLIKTRNKASQSIAIPEHTLRKSWGGTMTVDSIELICQYFLRLYKST
ncbi:histidine kinase-like ATPase, partial [Suillus subalutaceus]|uniref:histidine kinase-like ATPase n=1 Tax=Suillus subalutaceus TaxID=48586 RepID=UPI001B85F64D